MKSLEDIKQSRRLLVGRTGIDGGSGEVHMPMWKGSVIWSTGAGWDHVSVAPYKKNVIPSWDDMCRLKEMFFNDDEWVVQFHPSKDQYVSNVSNCLHLWKKQDNSIPTPPSILTGIREGQDRKSSLEEIKNVLYGAG